MHYQKTRSRHYSHEVRKLSLDRCQIIEDVGMIELQIIQNCGLWAVMHEFGALVEESRVVLVRLNDEKLAAGVAGGHREIHRNAANQESGRPARAFQDPGEHRRHSGLAVRTGDREDVPPGENVFRQPLRTRNVTPSSVEDRLHQRIAARDDVPYHPQVRFQLELLFAEPLDQLDAEGLEL